MRFVATNPSSLGFTTKNNDVSRETSLTNTAVSTN
ncbi:Uncharacterised protein [Rothia aeria]|uniref:Uncharacterized protein n=1 Tax=Rothia aeria TaxID=172042 RepID=A0A7Z9A765_9MICC|nr:Uncharacterised protein [Rothia aeria]